MNDQAKLDKEAVRRNISERDMDVSEGWTFGRFSRRCAWLHKFTISQMVQSFGTYQPISLAGRELRSGDRECVDRWRTIEGVLSGDDVSTVLDLGCAEGYFVRQAASQKNCVALGVDADIRRVTVAQNIASYEGIRGAGFLYGYVTPEFIRRLPSFDVVIFFSVLHHVMHEKGMDEAVEVMRAIRLRTKRKLLFDMGQSNEVDYVWAQALPPMEPNPTEWITRFLLQCGFSSVEVLGATEGYYKLYSRTLFAATP